MKVKLAALTVFVLSLVALRASAQDSYIHESNSAYTEVTKHHTSQHIQKRYNLFFEVNRATVDSTFKDNGKTLRQMREDITNTLRIEGTIPDSLLILSTASPDGRYSWNKRLAQLRAERTATLLLEMFPEFQNSHILVEYLEEDWGGLRQVLKAHTDFPQRDQMLAIIDSDISEATKKTNLKQCTEGWDHLVQNYIHVLRNSSITLSVIGKHDEYTISEPFDTIAPLAYRPTFTYELQGDIITRPKDPVKFRKTIFAARTNLLTPGLNIGLEFPIHEHWSFSINYSYPWAVSAKNRWCTEMLNIFVDAKYWFTGENTRWMPDSKLKGHGVGIYAGTGYYDFQNKIKGAQGEFIDFGVDYTYALPVAKDKLRFEFNLGLGFIKTWYRPYTPATDYTDLIKEPGVKYRSTNFIGPTRAAVSLVYPITVTTKKNPYTKMAQRLNRQAERKAGANTETKANAETKAKTTKAGGKND